MLDTSWDSCSNIHYKVLGCSQLKVRSVSQGQHLAEQKRHSPSIRKHIFSYYSPPFASTPLVINGCLRSHSDILHCFIAVQSCVWGYPGIWRRCWPARLQSRSLSLIISEFINTHLIPTLRGDLNHLHTNWLLSFARHRMWLLCIIINDKEIVNKCVRRY